MVNKIDLLSNDEFKKLVESTSCSADILKELGYSVKGNSWGYRIIKERMEELDISFGKSFVSNLTCGINKMTGKSITPLEEVLVVNSNYNRTKLKERLISEGLKEYKCECCGIKEWNSSPISLQLHHINGINNDNRLENLQLLCPNCHSQTDNFSTKGREITSKRNYEELPIEEIKNIMQTVSELGIVKARKILPYRSALINTIVKINRDIIVVVTPNDGEFEFPTYYAAARFVHNTYGIGKGPESSRTSIADCCNGKKSDIKGFKFYKKKLYNEQQT